MFITVTKTFSFGHSLNYYFISMYIVQGIRDTKINKIQSLIQRSLYFPRKNKKLSLIFKLSYDLGKGKK